MFNLPAGHRSVNRPLGAVAPRGAGKKSVAAHRVAQSSEPGRHGLTDHGLTGHGLTGHGLTDHRLGHFQRKWTKIRPKFFESFSTRW